MPVNIVMERVAAMVLFTAVILGGMGLLAVMLRGRQRMRELAIQERIALIDKGLVPSPESDPARFEKLIGLRRPVNRKAARYQSAGVLMMGLGAAVAVLLAFAAGIAAIGVGIGGGLAIVGLASFVNGSLIGGEDPHGPEDPAT